MSKRSAAAKTSLLTAKVTRRTSTKEFPSVSEMAKGDIGPKATKPNVPDVMRAEANRPVSSGVKHRGDRRDMSKAYTGNAKHSARGNNPRKDVSTRAR